MRNKYDLFTKIFGVPVKWPGMKRFKNPLARTRPAVSGAAVAVVPRVVV